MVGDEVLQDIENSQFLIVPQLLQLFLANSISSLLYLNFITDTEVRIVMRIIFQQIILDVFVGDIHAFILLLRTAGCHANEGFDPSVPSEVADKTEDERNH